MRPAGPHAPACGAGLRWWLFTGLLALVGSLPPEAVFVLVLLALALRLAELDFTLAVPPARLWAGPLACLALGALQLLGAPARDVARDVWLFSGPVVLALYGWSLVRRPADLRYLLRALVLGASAWSLLHLVRAAGSLDLLSVGREEFRQATGSGSLLPVIALFVLAGARAFGTAPLFASRLAAWACGAVCALAQVASFSRTWWGACAILCGALLLARHGAARTVWAGVLLGAVLWVLGALGGPARFSTAGLRAFAAQVSTEMLSAEDQVTQADLNNFWRSYEAYRGLQALQEGTPAQALIGRGLGARLDLGLYQLLEGEYRRHIPVLHNGFLYVVLKTGLAGLCAYLAWICCIGRDGWRTARLGAPEARLVGVLVVGLALVLLETSLVIGGAFNFQASLALFVVVGAAARWASLARAEHRAPVARTTHLRSDPDRGRRPRLGGEAC